MNKGCEYEIAAIIGWFLLWGGCMAIGFEYGINPFLVLLLFVFATIVIGLITIFFMSKKQEKKILKEKEIKKEYPNAYYRFVKKYKPYTKADVILDDVVSRPYLEWEADEKIIIMEEKIEREQWKKHKKIAEDFSNELKTQERHHSQKDNDNIIQQERDIENLEENKMNDNIVTDNGEFVEKTKTYSVSLIDQEYRHANETLFEIVKEESYETEKKIEESMFHSSEIDKLVKDCEQKEKRESLNDQNIETFENWEEKTVVDYLVPLDFIQTGDLCYAVSFFPQIGCHVYPYRRGRKTFSTGYMEKEFCRKLFDLLPKQFVEIRSDVYLVISKNNIKELDIALEIKNHPSIKIDIEIDEPYEAGNRKPTHYISSGDSLRNDELIRRGWVVVRFAEIQTKKYPEKCARYLSHLIKAIYPDFEIPADLENVGELPQVNRWTYNEALLMSAKKERENYLGANFEGIIEKKRKLVNFSLNENEQKCNCLIEKPEEDFEYTEKINSFADADRFESDKRIGFYAFEHIYINKTNEEQYLPVSSLINYFFEGFDALSQAEKQWKRYHIPIEESLRKWEYTSKKASEVGAFLHLQIENYFKNGVFKTTYMFSFDDYSEDISIDTEKQFFLNFINDYQIKPYRQEWPIFDDELNIAGTIDLICKLDSERFVIYDWKRSGKVINNQGIPIVNSYGYKKSCNGITLPDTSFFHYCIQQNLYRYILQKNYGIMVDELNLIVLWPEYDKYYKVSVPIMDDVINQLINICKDKDLGHNLLD